MRKSISIVICFALVINLILIGSYSDSYADTELTYGAEVIGRKVINCDTVYRVDVTWGKMQFLYKTVGTRTWNEKTHLFDEDFTSSWTASGNTIQVTNHSNIDVKAKFSYDKGSAYTGVVGKFNSSRDLELPSAEGRDVDDTELTGTRKLTLSGKIINKLDNYTSVGKIRIEID